MPEQTSATILLVDDNPTCLSLRKLMLERHGYRVVPVGEERLALLTLRTELISLVILDYFLEGTTGTQLASQMRQLKPQIPILLLSGAAEQLPGLEHVDCQLSKLEEFSIIDDTIAELLRTSRSRVA